MKIRIKKSQQGSLHRHLGIPEGEKIPHSELTIHENDSEAIRKKKQFALNAAKWKHENGGVHQYPDGGWATKDNTVPVYNPSKGYGTIYNDNDATAQGLPYSTPEGTFTAEGKQTANSYGEKMGSNVNWGQIAGQAANLAGPIYNLATNKRPKPFSYNLAQQTKLDPTQALLEADRQNKAARFEARNYNAGNSAAYLASMPQLQAGLTDNKNKIINDYANQNANTANQFSQFNTGIKNQNIDAIQQDQARYRDINRQAVSNLGENVTANYRDSKATKQDEETLDIISQMYPDFKYDKNKKGWYHRTTGEKLKPKTT